MILVQKGNVQLKIEDKELELYKGEGFEIVEIPPKTDKPQKEA